ncbi:hypothetical protein [Pectobacterium parvum]|uniref:Uncharacterized protein n=1 Tax=Pectobacterium parvum TaxID=2778550 RepID=A0ABW8G0H3_9GAMM
MISPLFRWPNSVCHYKQAYLEAEKIVIYIREQAKQRQVKQQFKLKIKSIKHRINSGKDYAYIPYAKNKKYWED